MHETLLLGIAASELTVLLTSDPRRWSRRLIVFLTLITAVACYSRFVLGVSLVAIAIATVLAIVWFGWDLADGSARSVLARWALATLGFLTLMSLNADSFPHLSLRSGRSIDLIITVLFLATGPVNHLITAILMCARGRATEPVPGWINAPVLPAMLSVQDVEAQEQGAAQSEAAQSDAGVSEAAQPGAAGPDSADAGVSVGDEEAPLTPSSLPIIAAQDNPGDDKGPALRGGRWIGPLERLLIIVLAGADAQVAIAAVVAAKGVIRFPEISQDSSGEKAEEFLIGSVSSWILAALVAMFIRVTLQP
ncbi:hypothetical protein [Actinomyces sp.]